MARNTLQDLDWDLVKQIKNLEAVLKDLPADHVNADALEEPLWSLPPTSASRSDLWKALQSRLEIAGPACESLELQMPGVDPDTILEIQKEVESGKILSQRSSTALAVNFFQPWRDRVAELGHHLGAPWVTGMHFEARYPTELSDKLIRLRDGTLGDRSPMLDVVLVGDAHPIFAIEAKFTEPYYRAPGNGFKSSYFTEIGEFGRRTDRLWAGVPTLKKLAIAMKLRLITFEYLHAAQLIKHALGLKRAHGREEFWLNYVWFDGADELSTAHRREIEVFCAVASNDIHIGAISYQEMASLLRTEPTPGYRKCMQSRYFDPVLPAISDRSRNQVLPASARQRPKHRDDEQSMGRVADELNHQSSMSILAEYSSLKRLAPTRKRDAGQEYFGRGHDRTVSKPSQTLRETHLQRAMTGKTLTLDGSPSIHLMDYEVPTKVAEDADRGLGEADLFGIDSQGSHVIVELKVDRESGANDTLVRALLEGLTYTAVLVANQAALGQELMDRDDPVATSGESTTPPFDARLLIAAPTAYWQDLDPPEAWMSAADRLIRPIADGTSLQVQLVDLGPVDVLSYETPGFGATGSIPVLWIGGQPATDSIRSRVVAEWSPNPGHH